MLAKAGAVRGTQVHQLHVYSLSPPRSLRNLLAHETIPSIVTRDVEDILTNLCVSLTSSLLLAVQAQQTDPANHPQPAV